MKIRPYLAALALLFTFAAPTLYTPAVDAQVADNAPRVQYTATGGQTAFSYTFEILAQTDLKVYQNGTLLALSTNYTVSGVGNQNGGTVTLTSGATAGDTIVIYRDMAISRTTDYQAGARLNPDTLDLDLDRILMGVQQVERDNERAIRMPVTDTTAVADMALPSASTRASKYLQFDADGKVTVSTGTTAAPASAASVDILDAGSLYASTQVENALQEIGTAARSFQTIALLKAGTARYDGEIVNVPCYYTCTTPDGGGGLFKWDSASSATDNGGTVLAPDAGGVGRWRAIGEMTAKRWGIKGDGTTDDTAKIQAAFNAMTSGGLLRFTQGTYKSTGEITVPYAITIVGDGRDATLFNFTTLGTNKSAFKATVDGVHFRDFKLTGPSSAAYVAEENGILFYGTSGANKEGGSVVNVEINNFGAYGVLAEHYNKVTVEKSYIHDIGYAGVMGLSADDMVVRGNVVSAITPGTGGDAYGISASQRSSEAVPVRFVFDGNTVDSVTGWEGIDTHGGTDGTISNNTITNCKYGINVSPANGSNTPPHRIAIKGNTIDSGTVATPGRGIGSGGYDASNKAEGLVVTGNVIKDFGFTTGYTDGAVMFKFTKGLVFTGNSIVDSVATGLGLFDSNSDFVVSGNAIAVVQAGHANASGIVVNAASQSGVIVGNMIETAASRYGIFMAAASADVSAFDNKIIATGGHYISPPSGSVLTGSATFDPGNLADGAGETTTVTVIEATLGDYAEASFSLDLQGITVTAWISSANTVSVRFQNETGGAIDLAEGTLRVRVRKP